MKPLLMLLVLFAACALPVAAQTGISPEATAIFGMLNRSAEDWNRGDIDAFATSYKNSPDILFIGRTITRGYAQMLEHYKTAYPTAERMGTLSFTKLEVQGLDPHFATVTGQFHLVRSQDDGGNQNGYFLLVVEKTNLGWKIVRDDTTALPSLD